MTQPKKPPAAGGEQEQEGRYPSSGGGDVPMEDWSVERVFDSSDYLERPEPAYVGDDGVDTDEPEDPEKPDDEEAEAAAG